MGRRRSDGSTVPAPQGTRHTGASGESPAPEHGGLPGGPRPQAPYPHHSRSWMVSSPRPQRLAGHRPHRCPTRGRACLRVRPHHVRSPERTTAGTAGPRARGIAAPGPAPAGPGSRGAADPGRPHPPPPLPPGARPPRPAACGTGTVRRACRRAGQPATTPVRLGAVCSRRGSVHGASPAAPCLLARADHVPQSRHALMSASQPVCTMALDNPSSL